MALLNRLSSETTAAVGSSGPGAIFFSTILWLSTRATREQVLMPWALRAGLTLGPLRAIADNIE
eukprot:14893761-Alexandrium_andersonii.AAC.1